MATFVLKHSNMSEKKRRKLAERIYDSIEDTTNKYDAIDVISDILKDKKTINDIIKT